jgi:HAD superfamily hydrolase (TIGR01490 family)
MNAPESIPAPGGASPGAASVAAPGQQQLVFFDLDETITRHDTLFPYALGFLLRKRPWRIPLLATVVPPVIGFLLGRNDEGKVKEAFIKATLGGSRRAAVEAWTASFVPRLLARGLFADAVKTVAEHRRRGDYLVLMSASTNLYVSDIARELGFDETVCTQVRWNGDTLDGSLTTPNRKGREKARCFTSLKGRHQGLATVAYGNSFSDLPHLCLANRGVLVNGSAKARLAAESFGVSCVEWS